MHDAFEGLSQDPMEGFGQWLSMAAASEPNDPNAAALATATKAGLPSVRMVLIKGADERGLRFYTNSESQKGCELQANPEAALCFHWKSLRKQVRFVGHITVLERSDVEAYFHSRSRASQIAAAVSAQSRSLSSRRELEQQVRDYAASLGPGIVPLPEFWIGYLLEPRQVEFWSDGSDRLHDRLQFNRTGHGWSGQRLYP